MKISMSSTRSIKTGQEKADCAKILEERMAVCGCAATSVCTPEMYDADYRRTAKNSQVATVFPIGNKTWSLSFRPIALTIASTRRVEEKRNSCHPEKNAGLLYVPLLCACLVCLSSFWRRSTQTRARVHCLDNKHQFSNCH